MEQMDTQLYRHDMIKINNQPQVNIWMNPNIYNG